MNDTPARILLVEDEAQIRKFLRISLEAHGYEVAEARLGEEALERCADNPPDLVVLDLGLPDMDGQDLIPRFRSWSQMPIIVLTVRSEEAQKVAVLDSGADDYVTKPFGIAELMARIRALLRNRSLAAVPELPVFVSAGLEVDLARREVTAEGKPVHLSRKEFELLRLLVTHAG